MSKNVFLMEINPCYTKKTTIRNIGFQCEAFSTLQFFGCFYKLRIAFSSCPKSQVTVVQRNAEIKLIPSQLVFQLQTVCKAIFMTFFQFLFFLLPHIFLGRMYNHVGMEVHIKGCNLFLKAVR